MFEATTLRPLTAADEPFLYRLYASTREEEMQLVNWSPDQKTAFLRMQFQAQHTYYQQEFPTAAFDVIELRGQPIGRLYVERLDQEIHLIDIALVPAYRQRGIGRGYMRMLLREARDKQVPVRLYVEQFNPAYEWYRRLGFRKIEDMGVYILMRWQPPKEQR